ncbi:MAG: hypothetical protein R3D26_10635 [Cyanobacteriota/Melainabacteria group bacterium]
MHRSLNIELQKRLNKDKGPKVSKYGWSYGAGDKVIQTVNNYDSRLNGDIGTHQRQYRPGEFGAFDRIRRSRGKV